MGQQQIITACDLVSESMGAYITSHNACMHARGKDLAVHVRLVTQRAVADLGRG